MKASNQFIPRTAAENLLIPAGGAAMHIKGLHCLSENGLLHNKVKGGRTRKYHIAALHAAARAL